MNSSQILILYITICVSLAQIYPYGNDYGVKPGTTKAVDKFIADTGLKLDNFYKDQFEIKI